jgi:hypothetical protein
MLLYSFLVKRISIILSVLLLAVKTITAQEANEPKLIQFSGLVMTADSLVAVPFASITLKNRTRGTSANGEGYFSFAAHEGDTIFFSHIGFGTAAYIIPVNLETEKYSVIQLMTRSEYYLKPTIIYPWGSREAFRQAFLDLKAPNDLEELARQNLEREKLIAAAKEMELSGDEATKRAMQTRAVNYSYKGQLPPQNIFNPLAWAEFIRAWKRGDFRKKE